MKAFPVKHGIQWLNEMTLRKNVWKGIGERKYKQVFLRVLLLKVSRKIGWQLDGDRGFLCKMKEHVYKMCFSQWSNREGKLMVTWNEWLWINLDTMNHVLIQRSQWSLGGEYNITTVIVLPEEGDKVKAGQESSQCSHTKNKMWECRIEPC